MADNGFLFISVIVPVYNGEKLISGCIESILEQDYPKDRYEIIIVDNGSTDDTRKICMEHGAWSMEQKILPQTPSPMPRANSPKPQAPSPLLYLFEPIRGSYKARNTGIKEARGDILAFTDADCIADKNWLKEGVAGFADESMGCAVGAIKAFKPKTYVEKYLEDMRMLSQEESAKFFGFLPYAQTANAFYRAEVFKKLGLFEGNWVSGADADFCWRMQLKTKYKICFVDNAVVYHKHRDSVGKLFRQMMKNGEGNALLQRKYHGDLKKRTLKQAAWVLFRLIPVSLYLVSTSFKKIETMNTEVQKRYLDNVVFLARELGTIGGSLKYKITHYPYNENAA